MNNELAAMCPCGHGAFHHPSDLQQRHKIRATGGTYSGECKGGERAHCRCVTSREEVIRADRQGDA